MYAPWLPRLRMSLAAEEAYLFTHATLREAAYQLWMPSDRARLHAFALEILEALPEAELGRLAPELAEHAHWAQLGVDAQRDAALLAQLREKELAHLARAAEAANKRYQQDRVIEYSSRALSVPGISDQSAMDFERTLGSQLFALGKLDDSGHHYTRLQALALGLGNRKAVAEALLGLGRINAARGKLAEAERYYNDSFAAAETGGDKAGMASALSWLAGVQEDTGRGHQSEALQLRAVQLASESENEGMHLATIGNLANHYRHTGKLEQSASAMREVLAGYERLGDERHMCVAMNNLARTLMLQGKLDEADAFFTRTLELQRPMGQTFSLAFSLGNVAEVWLARGKVREAMDALVRAIKICDEFAALMHCAAYKSSLAAAKLLLGEREAAQEIIEESRADFIHSGGEQYIPDYCDIVRLRIAADAATDSAQLAARKTAKVSALAPRASWLPVMRQILEGMKTSLARQKAGALELSRNIEKGQALLDELETAVRENRPARIYRGYRPEEISIELKAALSQATSGGLSRQSNAQPGI